MATVAANHLENPKQAPGPLPTVVAARLLDRLGSDDVFRALFQQNPAAALKQVGASDTEAECCSYCLKVTMLADKATIKSSSQALTKMLTTAMGFLPHNLGSR
jgi:putative modified peptide